MMPSPEIVEIFVDENDDDDVVGAVTSSPKMLPDQNKAAVSPTMQEGPPPAARKTPSQLPIIAFFSKKTTVSSKAAPDEQRVRSSGLPTCREDFSADAREATEKTKNKATIFEPDRNARTQSASGAKKLPSSGIASNRSRKAMRYQHDEESIREIVVGKAISQSLAKPSRTQESDTSCPPRQPKPWGTEHTPEGHSGDAKPNKCKQERGAVPDARDTDVPNGACRAITGATHPDRSDATQADAQPGTKPHICRPEQPVKEQTQADVAPAEKSLCHDTSPQEESDPGVSGGAEERKTLLQKHETMRTKYCLEADRILKQAREGLGCENIDITSADAIPGGGTDVRATEVPDCAVPFLARIIEGSRLPLTILALSARDTLAEAFRCDSLSLFSVTSKIKLLAKRKSYIDNPSVVQRVATPVATPKTNPHEDTNEDRMWRWEVISLDILPPEHTNRFKKARSARGKIRARFKATAKLLASLDQADRLLRDNTTQRDRVDAALAQVSLEEERVLRFEREAERARFEEEARSKKSKQKKEKQLEKMKKKEQKAAKQQEARERKKQELASAREELKKKKEREREEEKQRALLAREAELTKKKERMRSFFSPKRLHAPNNLKSDKQRSPTKTTPKRGDTEHNFEADRFRSLIDSNAAPHRPFGVPTPRALASRKQRKRWVTVTVMTAQPCDTLGAQPFSEQHDIKVPNRFKFLYFHEDCRPPYRGTWSKRSPIISGRNPFGKDTFALDYDVDSEAEWEEGDDELGEDLGEDAADEDEENIDEEGDTRVYNFEDGWLAEDGYLGSDEECDETTKRLWNKRPRSANERSDECNELEELTVRAVAPVGGAPLGRKEWPQSYSVMGYNEDDVGRLDAARAGVVANGVDVCLDAFPPALPEDTDQVPDTGASGTNTETALRPSESADMPKEDLKVFAEFVHNCTLGSKGKVVEGMKAVDSRIASNRARALRTLDSIADKKRNPKGGVCWTIKPEILRELGLERLLNQDPPSPSENEKEAMHNTQERCVDGGKRKSASGRKRKNSDAPASIASVNLLADFLSRRK